MDKPDYADRAVTEALVNALIHRDYIVMGSEVHIDMYDDRLEIYSPGGMYRGKQIQDCAPEEIGSVRRNPVIADLFHRMKFMERRGSGIRKILDETAKLPGYADNLKPIFHSTNSSFRVILKNLNYKTSTNEVLNGVLDEVLDNDEKMLLDFFRGNPKATQKSAIEQLPMSKRKVQSLMQGLMQKGHLERCGSKKFGEWIVKNKSGS